MMLNLTVDLEFCCSLLHLTKWQNWYINAVELIITSKQGMEFCCSFCCCNIVCFIVSEQKAALKTREFSTYLIF